MVEGIVEDPQNVVPIGSPSDTETVPKQQVGVLPHLLVGIEVVSEEDSISEIVEAIDGSVTERIFLRTIEVSCILAVRIFPGGIDSHS